jgi:hypothetical protein
MTLPRTVGRSANLDDTQSIEDSGNKVNKYLSGMTAAEVAVAFRVLAAFAL